MKCARGWSEYLPPAAVPISRSTELGPNQGRSPAFLYADRRSHSCQQCSIWFPQLNRELSAVCLRHAARAAKRSEAVRGHHRTVSGGRQSGKLLPNEPLSRSQGVAGPVPFACIFR